MKITKIVLAAGVASVVSTAAYAGTLEDVKARGVLRCVVSTGIAGFAYPDANGVWKGFDIDFCRATAAAVLGDSGKIKTVSSTGKTRFTLLNSGEGDVLWRNTTVTFSRDVGVKLRFHGINYYDGQGFMVSKSLGVKSATELDGASICIQTGTTTELNLADYFHANSMKYEAVPIETNPTLAPGTAERLFGGGYYDDTFGYRSYDVDLDGQRFLMITWDEATDTDDTPRLVWVENWLEELKRRVPPN
jgi:general L-amino acid transport system substrate-binding protein